MYAWKIILSFWNWSIFSGDVFLTFGGTISICNIYTYIYIYWHRLGLIRSVLTHNFPPNRQPDKQWFAGAPPKMHGPRVNLVGHDSESPESPRVFSSRGRPMNQQTSPCLTWRVFRSIIDFELWFTWRDEGTKRLFAVFGMNHLRNFICSANPSHQFATRNKTNIQLLSMPSFHLFGTHFLWKHGDIL